MEDLKTFLIEKVLMFESDTLLPDTEKVLQYIRREKTDSPVIFVSSGTSSVIAGSERTCSAIETYIKENEPSARLVLVGWLYLLFGYISEKQFVLTRNLNTYQRFKSCRSGTPHQY